MELRRCAPSRGETSLSAGSRMTNWLPRLAPSLESLHGSAVHFDQPAHQREPDSEAALRAVERVVDLGEEVEDGRELFGGDADAVIAYAEDGLAVRRATLEIDRPPSSVYLAALFSRLARTCARRTGSALTGTGSEGSDRFSVCLRASIGGRLVSTARATTDLASIGLGAELDLSAADPRDIEQVVDQSDHMVDLAGDDFARPAQIFVLDLEHSAEARPRCGSVRAGFAARGRASPGTRSCDGRFPGRGGRAGRSRWRRRRGRRGLLPARDLSGPKRRTGRRRATAQRAEGLPAYLRAERRTPSTARGTGERVRAGARQPKDRCAGGCRDELGESGWNSAAPVSSTRLRMAARGSSGWSGSRAESGGTTPSAGSIQASSV